MKDRIIETSLQQFLEHGIRKMTIQQLIAPLGLSTKTVYKYFPGKEELLEACLAVHYDTLYRQLEQADLSDPVLAIFRLLISGIELDFRVNPVFYHDLNHYYPDLQDKAQREQAHRTHPVFRKLLDDGIAQGLFHPDLDPVVVLQTIGVLYRSLTRSDAFAKSERTPLELADLTLGIYLRGLCTPKGLDVLLSHQNLTRFSKT